VYVHIYNKRAVEIFLKLIQSFDTMSTLLEQDSSKYQVCQMVYFQTKNPKLG
jgi:hypothetical protein